MKRLAFSLVLLSVIFIPYIKSQTLPPVSHVTAFYGDYDGDKKDDAVLFLTGQSYGNWRILKSSTSYLQSEDIWWGTDTDIPISGDFDGDGIKDITIFRPSTGVVWILKSSCNRTCYITFRMDYPPN